MTVVEPVLDRDGAERARLVNEHRAKLLRAGRVVTIDVLAGAQHKNPSTVRQWVRRQRRGGRLVYVVHDGITYVPTFQLDEAYDLDPTAADAIGELAGRGFSDWAIWTWFESRSPWLAQRSPADALAAGDLAGLRRALAGLFQE